MSLIVQQTLHRKPLLSERFTRYIYYM